MDVGCRRDAGDGETAGEFRGLLDAAGLNQEAAANVLGVNQATVCRWLNDSVPISAEKAALIRDRIGSRKK